MTAQRKKNYEPRPRSANSRSHRVRTQCGNLYITISRKDNKIFEVFATLGKSGGCMFSNISALSVSITMGIRHGVNPYVYIEKLEGINCQAHTWEDGILYTSCADAIAKTMKKELEFIESLIQTQEEDKQKKGNKTDACNSRDTEKENDNPNQFQGRQEL